MGTGHHSRAANRAERPPVLGAAHTDLRPVRQCGGRRRGTPTLPMLATGRLHFHTAPHVTGTTTAVTLVPTTPTTAPLC
jgi:hypothetical protein